MARSATTIFDAASNGESVRDAYGFVVQPQHLQCYRNYAIIHEKEEAERSARWEQFLTVHGISAHTDGKGRAGTFGNRVHRTIHGVSKQEGSIQSWTWEPLQSNLWPVECALNHRFLKKRRKAQEIDFVGAVSVSSSPEVEHFEASSPSRYLSGVSEDESEEEFYDIERTDVSDGTHFSEGSAEIVDQEEEQCLWKEELDALVGGGVPMALRGKVWQVFVGSSISRVENYYQALLTECKTSTGPNIKDCDVFKKWSSELKKDLPRTTAGYPAPGEEGTDALRHLLLSYACHKTGVRYCQALIHFAALLLLMMPEENTFWTLVCIIDDYFEGYYSEKMLESQVDQLVLEDLVRTHFPRLWMHLDSLGVQVAWVTGQWFSSIFVNVLPWGTVLRVWDVLLYEGNRSMLFRTTLALLELHGPAVLAAKDAADAVAVLQSLAGATFDGSQLVLTACVGYQFVNELKLQELRLKYHSQVLSVSSLCSNDKLIWDNTWERCRSSSIIEQSKKDALVLQDSPAATGDGCWDKACEKDIQVGKMLDVVGAIGLVEQVKQLKVELLRALEERRAAMLREKELEAAFMELVREDNRLLLSAKVEGLEDEVAQLKQTLAEKEQHELALLQVVMRMENEQRLTEDARQCAEEDASALRLEVQQLQAKCETVMACLKEMEKRALLAESMLEAKLQYQDQDHGHVPPSRHRNSAAHTREDESLRWSWPWITSKAAEVNPPSTEATESIVSLKANGEDSARKMGNVKAIEKQGSLSQRLSLAWREKTKSKLVTPEWQANWFSSEQVRKPDVDPQV